MRALLYAICCGPIPATAVGGARNLVLAASSQLDVRQTPEPEAASDVPQALSSVGIHEEVLNRWTPTQLPDEPQHGFTISFDELLTRGDAAQPDDAAVLDHAEASIEGQTAVPVIGVPDGTNKRVVFFDFIERHGIDDRIYVMSTFLAFTTSVRAALVFPTPQDSLGSHHGNALADWWDEYYVTNPPIFKPSESKCAPDAPVFKVDNLANMSADLREALLDDTKPLCMYIQNHFYAMGKDGRFTDLITRGASQINVWTSPKVTKIVQDAITNSKGLADNFNAVHVRLDDKATPECSDPDYILSSMTDILDENKEYEGEPWLLMSDGGDAFVDAMRSVTSTKGLTIVSENDISTLTSIEDNFLKYTVLECIFGGADIALNTFKILGHRCNPQGETHNKVNKFIKCNREK